MIGGWRACDACGATYALAAEGPCPRCGEALAAIEPPPWAFDPERAVPPAIDAAEARRRLEAFVAPVAFPSGGLASDNTAARLALVHLPRWRVGVDLFGPFRMEAGFETEVRGAVEASALGRWTSREITERRLHWEPRAGTVARRWPDLVVPGAGWEAPVDEPAGEPFVAERLAGPVAAPDRGPEEQWPEVRALLRARVAEACAEACEAAAVRALELDVDLGQASFAWELVPAWMTWYRDEDGGRHVLVVDGTSGRVTGPRMASPAAASAHARTASLLAAGLGVTGLLVGLLGLLVWVLLPLATLCLVAALAAGARSLVVPWRIAAWNRSELAPPRN